MLNKTVIFEGLTVYRSKPINLKQHDIGLFEHEYKKNIPKSFIMNLNHPIIINDSVIDIKGLSFHFKHTFYASHTFSKKIKVTAKNLFFVKRGSIKFDSGIWIVDSKSENFGHWIIDAMCRLMLVPESYKKYPVILPFRFNIKWILEMLNFLEINFLLLEKNNKYKIKELILTSQAHPSGNYNPELVKKLRSKFLNNVNLSKTKKTRRVWAYREHISRQIGNFDEIRLILKKYQFEIIKTEKLSILEKIKLFNDTKILAGTHSSGLINMIFMKENSILFEVRDFKDSHKNSMFSLASALDIHYFYTERSESLIEGDGKIDPLAFENALLECLSF